jgi:hypothetical protein
MKELTEKVKGQVTQQTSHEEREQAEKAVRLEVYRDICNSKVDSRVFLRHIQAVLNGPKALFQFRRTFAAHNWLAIHSCSTSFRLRNGPRNAS